MSAIPKDWKTARVKDLCHLGRGRVISGEEVEKQPGIYPVFSSQSKDNGRMGSIDTYDFDGEYVTWTTDGAYAGTVFHRTGKFNCTNVCGTLAAKEYELCLAFLAYKLETVSKDYVSYVGNPKLMNGVMAAIELALPTSKPEQTKIAEILSTVDRAIKQTEALIAKQQRIKTGLMQDLLTRGIDEQGNLRSEKTHKFKDSPLGRIPVEWEVTPAKDLCDAVLDCKNRTPPPTLEGHPVIRTPNVRSAEFVFENLDLTDAKSYETWTSRGKPRAGDVVITREAPFGEACQIPSNLPPPCLGQRMMMYQTNVDKLRADYLVLAINSEAVQSRLLELAGGSTVGHIRVGDIRNLPVPHPISICEQDNIASALSGASTALKKLVSQKIKINSLKTALMQDLLTGRKRVNGLINKEVKNEQACKTSINSHFTLSTFGGRRSQ